MTKETMTGRQTIAAIVLFLFGSTIIFGVNSLSKQDSWISIVASGIIFLPIALMYVRILKLNPEKCLYDIFIDYFGTVFGKILVAIFFAYTIFLGILIIRNYADFATIVSMTNTPKWSLMLLMVAVAGYIAFCGIQVLGKWSIIGFIFIAVVLIVSIIISIGIFNYSNILPVAETDFKILVEGTIQNLAFPFGEVIVFLSLIFVSKDSPNQKNTIIKGVVISIIIFLLVFFRNLFILGIPSMSDAVFPSYQATKIAQVGKFMTRIEGSISYNLILAGMTKFAICAISASKSLSLLFNLKSYKTTIIPVCLLTLILASIFFKTSFDMQRLDKIYPLIALPIQVLIPFVIWIIAEVKNKKLKNKTALPLYE